MRNFGGKVRERTFLFLFLSILLFFPLAGKPLNGFSGCVSDIQNKGNNADSSGPESSLMSNSYVAEAMPMTGFQTVSVGHERQMRGAWVATVYNINWPVTASGSVKAMKDYTVSFLDKMQKTNMNAVFFQVRPEADSFYKSSIEPWSRFLTGKQGQAPADGFDPLSYMITEAHKRGIEVHAWLNPYRAAVAADKTEFASNHVSKTMKDEVIQYGNLLWMDPGSKKVMDHTYNVVMDIVKRYDIDGIHFDDYFYPYPITGVDFPDDRSWNRYKSSGGTLSRDDWRRNNVNTLISRVHTGIKNEKPSVRFGISPFGIYRPGIPAGIKGRDQYSELYADPLFWLQAGILDYVAPQLYWPTTSTDQNYDRLLDWWLSVNPHNKDVYVGHALYRLNKNQGDWSTDEMRRQLRSIETRKNKNATGSIMYNLNGILENEKGIADIFRTEFWQGYVLPPPIPGAADRPSIPKVDDVLANTVNITPDKKLKGYGLYEKKGSDWHFQRLLLPTTRSIELSDGVYAMTSISRSGLESKGVVIPLPQTVYPESLELSRDRVNLTLAGVRSRIVLRPVFYPLYTSERALTWRSSNPDVAEVSVSGTVTVNKSGETIVTSTTGDGKLQASCTITVEDDDILYGDVTGEGTISVSDAIMVLRHVVGIANIPEESKILADVNDDNKIDVSDAIIILRYIVGL